MQTFFSREWLYRPNFYQGTLAARFSRGIKTGCTNVFNVLNYHLGFA